MQTLTAFVGGFGSGFGAWPMPTFGLWVFVFVFLSLGPITAALHFRILDHADHSLEGNRSWRLGVIVLFWSAFGLGMSPYYINRSVVSGQLQFLLFPAFFASAALLVLMRTYTRPTDRDMVLVIAALPAAISLASIVDHPSFTLAMKRLSRVEPSIGQLYEPAVAAMKEKMAQLSAQERGVRMGLFTDFGFIPASRLRVRSYLPVNHQDDLEVTGESLGKETCSLLLADNNDVVISNVVLDERAMKMIGSCGYVLAEESGSEGAGLTVLKRR